MPPDNHWLVRKAHQHKTTRCYNTTTTTPAIFTSANRRVKRIAEVGRRAQMSDCRELAAAVVAVVAVVAALAVVVVRG